MDLSWLEALVATVEHGSFQTAAQKLGVSRATLRSRVEALESRVGLPLLIRTVRGVELTDAGGPFLDRARALLAEAASLARFSDEHGGEVTGTVRIRAPVGMPSMMHAFALSEMRRRYPGVKIHFEVHPDPPAGAELDADFVLHFCPRIVRGDFHTVRLSTFPVRLIAHPGYLAERGAPQRPEELSEHALLSWTAPGEDGRRWPLKGGGWLQVDPAVWSADIGVVRGLASAGMGIALVPDPEDVGPFVSRQDVVPVLPGAVGAELSLWLLMPTPRAGAGRTRALVEITKDIVAWTAARSVPPV